VTQTHPAGHTSPYENLSNGLIPSTFHCLQAAFSRLLSFKITDVVGIEEIQAARFNL
jgi:hypothetical protein